MEIYIGNHLEETWLIYRRHRNFPRCRLHLHNHRIYRRIEYIEVSHISVQPNYDPMNIWNEYSNDFNYKTEKWIFSSTQKSFEPPNLCTCKFKASASWTRRNQIKSLSLQNISLLSFIFKSLEASLSPLTIPFGIWSIPFGREGCIRLGGNVDKRLISA